ncbi:hypothetical protein [Micrococcoides hystricis]|uniref:TetR transcriptional regulator Rv1219c-like C-terminal domain-containing protein n=1 Tax=Micrococcoides hystricis TaxID=1572761 RepID=A0ABV6PCV0_9MICC
MSSSSSTQPSLAPPLMAYTARTLAEGSEHADALVDALIEAALVYTREGVEAEVILDHPRLDDFIKVLTIWQLGSR